MKSHTKQPSLRKRLVERVVLALLLLGICSVAIAKLPPPTPEEQAQAAAQKSKAAADAETEKALLEKVQDKIAARYLAQHKDKVPTSSGSSGDSEVPSAADPPTVHTPPAIARVAQALTCVGSVVEIPTSQP